ncbi:carbohydrate ABC transporter permease [Pelagovum pacificum]|uniref:Sugar ABC transporter permease n=1 Tax=Pelagovum pacificum TaxID=2588711 RepID=A0A5C5GFX6_9RHOB|nr:sugar ABC transporter permease [Pelagovum pacificum]QQA43912.1 sugar ABC transporter permease [Pelagovum pacificum]TNY32957.1 sugar ABC transporter permease [Pelagovum pacificum]
MTVQAHKVARLPWHERVGYRFAGQPLPWLLPVILILGFFYLYPVFDVFRFAATDVTLIGQDYEYTSRTIQQTITNNDLPFILWITLIFTAGSVIGQQLLGLIIAMVVIRAERRRLFGPTILRTTALVAWVVPGIAVGLIWQMLFSEAPFGGLNSLLRMFGISPVYWLSDPQMAMWSVIISNIWRGTAFSMVVMYAALKAIDPVLYEAAEVDGASGTQKFRFVTLPQLRAAILVNMILITIQTVNTFDAIIALTGGGPGRATEVISLYAFNIVFRNYDLAAGSVISVIMLMISLILSVIYALFLPKGDTT